MNAKPCPSCIKAWNHGVIRQEAIQPLPEGVGVAPLNHDGNPWCFDCASADTVQRFMAMPTWGMARTAVSNDRQEQYRLPGAPMGLVYRKMVRPSEPGDFEKHLEWLDEHFGSERDRTA